MSSSIRQDKADRECQFSESSADLLVPFKNTSDVEAKSSIGMAAGDYILPLSGGDFYPASNRDQTNAQKISELAISTSITGIKSTLRATADR